MATLENDYDSWKEAQDERREQILIHSEREFLRSIENRFNGEEI